MPARKSYHHGDLRRSLVEHAAELIGEVGIERVTLKALAKRAGVSHTAPYRHFEDLSHLFQAVGDEGIRKLATVLRRAHEKAAGDAEAQFYNTGWAYIDFAYKYPGYSQTMFGPGRPQTLTQVRSAPSDTAMGALREFIQGWQDDGLFKKGDPFRLALQIWAVTHGLASLLSSQRLKVSRKAARELSDETHRSLLDGLRAD